MISARWEPSANKIPSSRPSRPRDRAQPEIRGDTVPIESAAGPAKPGTDEPDGTQRRAGTGLSTWLWTTACSARLGALLSADQDPSPAFVSKARHQSWMSIIRDGCVVRHSASRMRCHVVENGVDNVF